MGQKPIEGSNPSLSAKCPARREAPRGDGMRTTTLLVAFALAAAIPTAAQTLDYGTLRGATDGTGDHNDLFTLPENGNRFYFDHKRGRSSS